MRCLFISVLNKCPQCFSALTNPEGFQAFLHFSSDIIEQSMSACLIEYPQDFQDTWPPVTDVYFNILADRFNSQPDGLMFQLTVVWVLLLRSQCGLRGLRPAQLLELDFKESSTKSLERSAQQLQTRREFILQCFRRLNAQDTNIVYRLSSIWALDSDDVKLANITALVELGNNDDLIEDLIPTVFLRLIHLISLRAHFIQISDCDAMLECILECLRIRFGTVFAKIERIPQYSRAIASMDPTAVHWARSAVGNVDIQSIEAVLKGGIHPLAFSLTSTRHLVINDNPLNGTNYSHLIFRLFDFMVFLFWKRSVNAITYGMQNVKNVMHY